jgi:hypothetical protein
MIETRAHIVVIRRQGVIEGHQLRMGDGGAGRSKFFGAKKYGSPEQARRAAEREAMALGLSHAGKRGGSTAGRLLKSSSTRAAGIRFEWTPRSTGPVLRVVATWVDARGVSRHTSYSVERNGLAGALDRALAARTSGGAPHPDREALLSKLENEYASRQRQH